MISCWLDFWTSNSTMSYKDWQWKVHLVNLWENKPETRTVLFWDNEENKAIIGDTWIERFVNGHSGRLIQSPKSFLNAKEEVETIFWWKARKLGDIITPIISHFKKKLELATWIDPTYVKLGRPVRFHDTDEKQDKIAQNRLERYAINAWFKNVDFELEPVAAAKTFENPEQLKGSALIVADFWWGTSDFSIVVFSKDWQVDVLANSWVYVAWNSFDQRLSLEYFSSFLGRGSQFRSVNKLLEIPSQPYFLLSDWKTIHQINDQATRQAILEIRWATDPDAIDRLMEIASTPELGYEYFRMVEQAKIATSTQDPVVGRVNFFRKAFDYTLSRTKFNEITLEQVAKIRGALRESMNQAWVDSNDIGKILLVWGTWQLRIIQEMLTTEIWAWKLIRGDTFNAIGKGLSIS